MAPKNVYRPGRSVAQGGGELSKKQKAFQKKYTRPSRDKSNKDDNKKEQQQILKDIDKAQKQKDNKKTAGDKAQTKKDLQEGIDLRQSLIYNTSEFLDDLKDAYKSGLFTGGTKTKALMEKYDLEPSDIVKLRVGIGQGLGTNISGTNVLQDVIKERGLNLDTSFVGGVEDKLLKARAESFFEPGMSKYDKLPLYENPEGIFQTAANMTYQYNPILRGFDFIAGGSPQGMRGLYFGREQLGLEGEELDQFAAAVANDPTLYEGIMNTPTMQRYELDEFRAEANRNMIANRSDPDPISGTQPGAGGGDDSGGSDEGTTDPGSSYTPVPQNTYTFFDPNLGRYRSGTYDEYLQYVTAKDGGIIQLSKGGNDEDPIAENKKVNLRNIIAFIEQNKNARNENKYLRDELANVVTTTDDQISVKNQSQRLLEEEARKLAEEDKLLGDMLKERFTDQEHITELSVQSGDAVKMAEEDQPAKGILNIELPSDSGPALREDLGLMGKIKDSGMSLLMEALRKSDISTGSANQFIEEALNNFVAAGIIPPNTSYDQLTDPFKDLVTREAAMIANSMAKPIDYLEGRDMESMQLPNMSFDTPDRGRVELPMTILKGKEGDESMIRRSTSTVEPTMYEVADGGIIGLKDGGMNDMMQADSLMFRDPSDEGQWEYNV